ncbi:MAG: CPBP family intramembrane metalloprotease [Epulopiscium sp.]|nr:CPBP family intramembrane metalloprotease [Candidatus Epulonipiscium sp.]
MKPVFRSNLFAMILILIWIMGSVLVGLMKVGLDFLGIDFPYLAQIILPQILFLLLPCILYILITGTNAKDTFRFYSLNIKSIFLVIGFALSIQPLMMLISGIGSLFFSNPVNEMLEQISEMPLALMILMIGITPALFEELPFRGIILSGYKNISTLQAALLSGLFFGVLHMNFQQFIYAFVMGVFFAYLVEITGSIFSSMIAHFTINSSQVLFSQLALWAMKTQGIENMAGLSNPSFQEKILSIITILPLVLFLTPLAFLLMYILCKEHDKNWDSLFKLKQTSSLVAMESVNEEKIITWPVYVSIGIFIIFSIFIEIVM